MATWAAAVRLQLHVVERQAVPGSTPPVGARGRRNRGLLRRALDGELVDAIRPDEIAILFQPGFELGECGVVMRPEVTVFQHVTHERFVFEAGDQRVGFCELARFLIGENLAIGLHVIGRQHGVAGDRVGGWRGEGGMHNRPGKCDHLVVSFSILGAPRAAGMVPAEAPFRQSPSCSIFSDIAKRSRQANRLAPGWRSRKAGWRVGITGMARPKCALW